MAGVRAVAVTPYYEDEKVTLHHGDCLSLLPAWAERADVLVTDPPYGLAYTSNRPRRTLAPSIAGDLDTTVRDAALFAWHGADPVAMPRPALVFGTWRRERPPAVRQVLIWDTKGALGMGALDLPWKPSHQEIYVIGRGFKGRRSSDVLTCAPVQSLGYNGRTHPHEKPVDLLSRLIDKCPPGVIADPFAGSGTTLVAAKKLGRRAIGVEIDERYCEIAAKRLAQGVLDFGEAS